MIKKDKYKIIASYSILNTIAVVILDIDYSIDDYVITGISNENDEIICIGRNKIRNENNTDRQYFNKQGNKYYLDEFIRVSK